MTTDQHELTECKECGSHYCIGCVGKDCPNCKLQEVGFYAIVLENKIGAAKRLFAIGPLLNVETLEDCQQAVDDWLGKMMNVLETEG